MAETVSNIRLEYGPNTIELWRIDDAGDPMSFAADTQFYIERVDNSLAYISGNITFSDVTFHNASVLRAKITIDIEPLKSGVIYQSGDELYDHETDTFIHIYSLKSSSDSTTYMAGRVNIYETAGPN